MPGSSPTQSASYLYDGAGQRVQQAVTSSGATTTTSYIGSLEEVTQSGSAATTTAYYGSLAESVNGALSYLLSDGLGSVSEAVNTSGGVTATQLYAPYGGVRYQSGTLPTDHGYTGQISDATTSGLDYYGARSYDPVAGQFTSADTLLPQSPAQPDPGQLNRYAYVAGNPESATDPTGHMYVPGDSGSGGEPWVAPNNRNFPNTREAFHQHVGYPGQYENMDADTKGPEEDADGLKLWAYLGSEWQDNNGQKHHEGPDVWKIYADWGTAFLGTSADYLVGYPTPIVRLCGVVPCVTTTLAPLTPIDLYTPLANTSDKNIMSYAVSKGNKQAAIIAIDVTNNKALHGNAAAQSALANRIINFQPTARAGKSVMRVIFIDGDNINDVDPFSYGPQPGGDLLT